MHVRRFGGAEESAANVLDAIDSVMKVALQRVPALRAHVGQLALACLQHEDVKFKLQGKVFVSACLVLRTHASFLRCASCWR